MKDERSEDHAWYRPTNIKFWKMQTTLHWHKADDLARERERRGKGRKEGFEKSKRKLLEEMDMFIILTVMMALQVQTCVRAYRILNIKCMSFTACEQYLNTALKEKCNPERKQWLITAQNTEAALVTSLSCQRLLPSLLQGFCRL